MDEYTMSWSDAIRAESSFSSDPVVPPPPALDVRQFGTLGRALWLERTYARLLARNDTQADPRCDGG